MSPLDIPDNQKLELLKKAINPGTVIRFFDTSSEKEKRVIILGIDDENILVCYVRLNSILNTNIHKTPEQQATQFPMKESLNDFLDHDSFVDCSQLVTCKLSDVIEYIKDIPTAILGSVNKNDIDVINSIVISSPTSIPKILKKFNLI